MLTIMIIVGLSNRGVGLMNLKLNILLGTMIGLTIGFILMGFWQNEFDWKSWIVFLLFGTIGHFTMAYISKRKNLE
jgi:hypothetical protein